MSDLTKQELDDKYDHATAIYKEGRHSEALFIYRSLADAGFAPAYFKLALHEFYSGEQELALPWLALLEHAAARPDALACFLSFHAYRAGWARGGFDKDGPIGSEYLQRAAELGHNQAQLMLALEHRSGANGQVKDETLYLNWINRAVEGGSEDAVYDLAQFLFDKRRPIPESLMADLKIVAEDWPNAAKLFDKLKRRPSPK